MIVSTSRRGATETVHVKGRFDFSAHREFRDAVKAAMADAAVTDLEIDLSAADYIDSAALGMLLLSLENAKAAGKGLWLARPVGAVKEVLGIANFQRLFEIR